MDTFQGGRIIKNSDNSAHVTRRELSEQDLKALFDQGLNCRSSEEVGKKSKDLKNTVQDWQEESKRSIIDEKKAVKEKHGRLKSQLKTSREEHVKKGNESAEVAHKAQKDTLKSELKKAKDEKAELEVEKKKWITKEISFKKYSKFVPSKEMAIDAIWFIPSLISAFILVEYYLTSPFLVAMELPDMYVVPISVVLSVFVGVGAHVAGYALAIKRWFLGLACLAISLSIIIGLATLVRTNQEADFPIQINKGIQRQGFSFSHASEVDSLKLPVRAENSENRIEYIDNGLTKDSSESLTRMENSDVGDSRIMLLYSCISMLLYLTAFGCSFEKERRKSFWIIQKGKKATTSRLESATNNVRNIKHQLKHLPGVNKAKIRADVDLKIEELNQSEENCKSTLRTLKIELTRIKAHYKSERKKGISQIRQGWLQSPFNKHSN
jgi:hypothetical protein